MDGVELETALGKTVNMSFTYVGPEGTAPQTGEQPTTEVPQTEVPQTGDMSVVMFALVLFLALSAAVLLKKRAF